MFISYKFNLELFNYFVFVCSPDSLTVWHSIYSIDLLQSNNLFSPIAFG